VAWAIPIDDAERDWWRKVATPELAQRLAAQIAHYIASGLTGIAEGIAEDELAPCLEALRGRVPWH